ncbi:MAG: sigma-70 family RNA polymerase sigma factor, partial [Candidatus Poribacteria bacterium]|nr:sigma-70 family RNA polymerase sigma factor [Candidatus Poribacteria bacterium]
MEDDAQLIYRVLSGDDEAFTALVRKHQQSVHALAWRRVDDFHFAEEITQDTFLQAYKKLSTLKNPSQFSGWLYVIANRRCNKWLLKNKSAVKSLEEVSMVEIENIFYESYVSEQNEEEARTHRHKLVRKLLDKLPESERTVMTLYYLGEMTTKEISKFLGVSVNTITSRLQRARKRLQQDEEFLVQEILGGVQLSNTLTEDIARKVADVKLTPPANWKPFIPWTALGAAVVLVVLLLSASDQYLLRFQQPYSFEAESERTIEIIDAPVVLKSEAKPAVRNQAGRAAATDRNGDDGIKVSASILVSNAEDELVRLSESRWMPTFGPGGGSVFDVFATSAGTVYAFSQAGTYRLVANATAWVPVAVDVPTGTLRVPMAEHDGVLYLVSNDIVFTSTDDGEEWNVFCARPDGDAIEFVITDAAQTGITMYLAFQDKGVFCSTDAGEQWVLLNDGLMDRTISAMTAIGGTVFAGTDSGLYRLDAGIWKRLLVDVSGSICALAVSESDLYVGTGPGFRTLQQIGSKPGRIAQAMYDNNASLSKVFRSADFGASWTEITPTDGSHTIRAITGINLLVAGETILAQAVTGFRSRDSGKTWVDLGFDMNSSILGAFPSVAVNENTFYKAGLSGIHRTTDAGDSWHLFIDGMVGTRIQDLAVINNRLYAHTEEGIVQSTDGGKSWTDVRINDSEVKPKSVKERDARLNFSAGSRLTIAGNILYVISPEKDDFSVFRSSDDGKALIPIQTVPVFDVDVRSIKLLADSEATEQVHLSESPEKVDDLHVSFRREHERIGAFVVSGETFYTEYQRKLFKWQPGDAAWKDTRLVDTGEQPDGDLKYGFRLAVSGE